MHGAQSEKDKIKIGSGNSWKPKQISSMLERLWTPGDRRSGLHSQTRQFHPGDRYHCAQQMALTVVHKGVKLHCTSAHAPCNEGKRKRELCKNKSQYQNVTYSDPDVHGNPLTRKTFANLPTWRKNMPRRKRLCYPSNHLPQGRLDSRWDPRPTRGTTFRPRLVK